MDSPMFCYQCEQTLGGKACTKVGVCGKSAEIAALQDLLIFQLKGIACYGKSILDTGGSLDSSVFEFIEDSLFTTLTNVNFDSEIHISLLKESQKIKEKLRLKAKNYTRDREETDYNLSSTKEEMLNDAKIARLDKITTEDPDIISVKHTILYGLKGISAYSHQARFLNCHSDAVDKFFIIALDAISNKDLTLTEAIELMIKAGNISLEVMKILDEVNCNKYENPIPTKVNVKTVKGPFIIISGHDLKDLELLLEQTAGTGVNVYTHGEMLPGHGYPELKKHPHLVGNFGSAWQNQQKEFDNIPGCILMTTNCLMKPRDSYKDRIFTTNVVGWDDIKHIPKLANGKKDFSEIISKALELGGFASDEEKKEILVGFGHNATLSNAEAIISAVKNGYIKHFFVIGGCDGAKPGRNYFTELAQKVPKDCVILTLACGKYRFNKLEFGEICGIPRLLDIGQCNDAYSATKIALALADAFDTNVNNLPLSIVLSWYEQKAVADLLALLALGIKNIHLGPSLPAFVTPNVLQYLVD
ncbi:MAG: hydroxylamine reductase, partial [Sarcina sp.]